MTALSICSVRVEPAPRVARTIHLPEKTLLCLAGFVYRPDICCGRPLVTKQQLVCGADGEKLAGGDRGH